ncbi:signal peptide peptidase SppA [Candidatus Termititenax persephonae]|uniref:Signal peptide peptidase SppA n=1 Tax=Candidatus Termititenax persephonae TaxID=2218525 RepID=A0A388TH97_9BACT|nr:signal peptide peptidase SppA [Candidatus Termititenax persephonae]
MILALGGADATVDILRRDTGVRALGMGGAFTGTAVGVSALYYNPAGLARPGLQFTYSEDDTSQQEYQLGIDSAVQYGSLGFGRRRFVNHSSEYVDAQSIGFGLSGGHGIDYGLTYHRVVREMPGAVGSAWTADVGLLLQLTSALRLGLTAQDLLKKDLAADPSLRAGVAYALGNFLFAADSGERYGAEWQLTSGFTLRLGFHQGNPTYGLGLGWNDLTWDYAVEKSDGEHIYRWGLKLGNELYPQVRQYTLFPQREVLLLELDSSLIAGQSDTSLFGGNNVGLDLLLQKIRVAAEDKNIAALIIRLQDMSNSVSYAAVLEELRAELIKFKQKGKYIVVYIENQLSANAYYLATAADKIVMPSLGALVPAGHSLTVTRYKGLLEKVGLTPLIISTGEYKDALNPWQDGFTARQREHLELLVKDINAGLLSEIKKARQIATPNMADIADGGIISAREALAYKLVDALGYYDTAENQLRELLKMSTENVDAASSDLVYITPAQLPSFTQSVTLIPDYSTIVVVDIDGELVDGVSRSDFLFGGKMSGAGTVVQELRDLREKDYVKAVILRVNSPGGSALAADRIYKEVQKLREQKKYVVASVGNIAASGGYYIAAAADEIYANPNALVGSIGVIGQTLKAENLFRELGIKQDNIKTAEHADMHDWGRGYTEAEVAMLRRYQAEVYDQFKLAVAQGRNLHIDEVEILAQGKIYSARRAVDLKLIDQLGTLSDALEAAKRGAKIKGRARIVRQVQTADGWLQFSYNMLTKLGLDKLSIRALPSEPAALKSYIQ